MARVQGEIVIERPVEVVFDCVADQRNEPTYNPRMLRSEKLTDGPGGRRHPLPRRSEVRSTADRHAHRGDGAQAAHAVRLEDHHVVRRHRGWPHLRAGRGWHLDDLVLGDQSEGPAASADPPRRPPGAPPGEDLVDRAQAIPGRRAGRPSANVVGRGADPRTDDSLACAHCHCEESAAHDRLPARFAAGPAHLRLLLSVACDQPEAPNARGEPPGAVSGPKPLARRGRSGKVRAWRAHPRPRSPSRTAPCCG